MLIYITITNIRDTYMIFYTTYLKLYCTKRCKSFSSHVYSLSPVLKRIYVKECDVAGYSLY